MLAYWHYLGFDRTVMYAAVLYLVEMVENSVAGNPAKCERKLRFVHDSQLRVVLVNMEIIRPISHMISKSFGVYFSCVSFLWHDNLYS